MRWKEALIVAGAILPVALTNEDIRNSESYKEYYARASGIIPPKTKGSKKKANTDIITSNRTSHLAANEKEVWNTSKQKTTELETISEADLTEAEQLKIITKRSRQETHSSHASGSGADEGTGVTPGVPDAPDYDSEDDISWKSSDDDQDDEQAQDDEDAGKNDVNETTQDDEDDDDHDDDEKVQDDDEHDVDETVQEDDDEEQTESDDDGDDFVHPKLTTHDDEIIHEEDTDEDDSSISSSDEEDSDNEVEGTNVEGAKTDEEATYEEDQGTETVEDTKTDLDGRDEVMTDVLLSQVQATQEIEDTHVTLTPVNPDGQQQSSLKAPRRSKDRCRSIEVEREFEKSPSTANQQFLESIDDGMKKIIKEQVKKEVSKIIPKVEKLVTDQLESEVLVRSSKEANTSHAVAANLSELELKKILIDKMEANNSINRSEIQRQLYKALVEAYEADQILLDTYGDTVTIKRPRDGADDDQEPSAGTDRGSKRRRLGKEPASTSAPSETTTKTAGKTTKTGTKTHTKSASQSAPVGDAMHSTDDPRESFDELTDSTFDFSAFVLNRLNVQTLTPELLAGPTFELMKGTCKSLTELEYFCEEVYKATTEKLDWINPEVAISCMISATSHYRSSRFARRPPQVHDGTLDDVRTVLNDRLKGIRMEYLPETFWSQRDKANARAMIQAIDKRLKTRRIMRSLERFVGGRPYGGDLRLLQRTI
ncbi:hypothetical protein Tco_0771341 [Tanacetum coccineum]|uniref:Uncharacterized protein n=1 Tax=Tanacetum coccineum TaxID=301880 RepID=A0ABQ4ZI38_9ASTR